MADSSGDENDSRTASVGLPRLRANGTGNSISRHSSSRDGHSDSQTANPGQVGQTVRKGISLSSHDSEHYIKRESDGTSSSASYPSNDEEPSKESESGSKSAEIPAARVANRAIQWNRGTKSAIRTTLAGRTSGRGGSTTPTTAFHAINQKYWRSRSTSSSSAGGDIPYRAASALPSPADGTDKDPTQVVDSDESESGEATEGEGDSIMLNLGSRNQDVGSVAGINGEESGRASGTGMVNGDTQASGETSAPISKDEAYRLYSLKYAVAPSVLADLDQEDLEVQAKYFFYDRESVHDIDLQAPIICIECLQEGHLAFVCPQKECVHCGAWNQHQDIFCPSWRRCQKCRERGHDAQGCSSLLKGSSSEIPCDLCGSSEHLELDCDFMWKRPLRKSNPGPVVVSISCSFCTSNRHLVGDCPSLTRPMKSSSWTLRGIDPAMITNLNSVVGPQKADGRVRNARKTKSIGRSDRRSPSFDSDDMLARPDRREPFVRNQGRGSIRIANGVGRDTFSASLGDPRQYRDRTDTFVDRRRQRSRSPNPRSIRGDSMRGGRWKPPLRSGQAPPTPRRTRDIANGVRGGGRNAYGKRSGSDWSYR